MIFSIASAYCVLCQTLPQRPSTVLMILLLGLSAFYVAMITNIPSIPLVFQHPQSHIPLLDNSIELKELKVYSSIWKNITNAIQFFILAFYASIHHGPLQVILGGKSDQHPIYASYFMVTRLGYSCTIHLVSGFIRYSVWISVVCFQSNMLHALLELNQNHSWGWFPSYLFMTVLLYESTWMVTQINEQVFCWEQSKITTKLKMVLLVLSNAAMFQFHHVRWLFIIAQLLSILSVANTLLSHK